jgi:hypothetical protein
MLVMPEIMIMNGLLIFFVVLRRFAPKGSKDFENKAYCIFAACFPPDKGLMA